MSALVNITPITGRSDDWQIANLRRDSLDFAREVARFYSLITPDSTSDCLRFIRRSSHGYGVFSIGRQRFRAHRFMWMLHHGPIPSGMVVCHACDHPWCVRLDHLRLDTQAGNIHESVRKARKNCFGHQRLSADRVIAIRRRFSSGEVTQARLASEFGIARNTVSQIVNGKTWGHLIDGHAQSVRAKSDQSLRDGVVADQPLECGCVSAVRRRA